MPTNTFYIDDAQRSRSNFLFTNPEFYACYFTRLGSLALRGGFRARHLRAGAGRWLGHSAV